MSMEETGVQQQRETVVVDETTTGSVDEVLGHTEAASTITTMEEAIGNMFPDTPAPDRVVPSPQAHRGRITGVTAETTQAGQRYLKVSWTSLETAGDDNLGIFPPQEYVDNVLVDP